MGVCKVLLIPFRREQVLHFLTVNLHVRYLHFVRQLWLLVLSETPARSADHLTYLSIPHLNNHLKQSVTETWDDSLGSIIIQ